MPKKIFTQELEGTRRRGRPRKRWREVERYLQVLGVRRWRELVIDRDKWRGIVRQAKAHSGLQRQRKKKKKSWVGGIMEDSEAAQQGCWCLMLLVRQLPGEDIALVFDRSSLRSVNTVRCQLACYCKYLNIQCFDGTFQRLQISHDIRAVEIRKCYRNQRTMHVSWSVNGVTGGGGMGWDRSTCYKGGGTKKIDK